MIGVGIIGAGPGVSALHLPTAARHAERLRVVHFSDGGSGHAAELATRAGARHSTGVEALLADRDVDVVVIASPPHLHAQHALAAIAAGKRGVLCEKPLALDHDDVDAVIDAAVAAGTTLVVGTNHLFDPAWGRARHHAAAAGHVRTIAITASLPPNGRYHEVVTDAATASAPRPAPDLAAPGVAAAIVRQLVLGLLIHDLPLVRDLAAGEPEVLFARLVRPIGCAVGFRVGQVLVQATVALQPDGAEALWRMAVTTATDQFEIEFPPSFVHAGSAVVRVFTEGGVETTYPPSPADGYVQEWQALVDALTEGADGDVDTDDIRADAHFAITVADAAADLVRGTEAS